MTNQQQFYTLLVAAASSVAVSVSSLVAVVLGLLTNNKRLDDVIGRLGRMEGTLDAVRQDLSDVKRDIRGHDIEIANLKERGK